MECFSPTALETTRRLSLLATGLFVFLSVAPYVPQCAKILIRRSSDGVSPAFVALMVLAFWLQSLNLGVLHFDQLAFCWSRGHAAAFRLCDHSATTLIYVAATFLAAVALFVLVVRFLPVKDREAGRFAASCLVVSLVVTGVPAFVGLAVYRACGPLAAYGSFLGLALIPLFFAMYVPQIAETISLQRSGALSYVFLSLHFALGVASAAQKALGTHERAVTWAPPLVASAGQLALIALGLHYDCKRSAAERENGGKAAEGGVGEGTPLLPRQTHPDAGEEAGAQPFAWTQWL